MHLKDGEFADSIKQNEAALKVFTSLVEKQPENSWALRDLAWGNYFLGEAYILGDQQNTGLETLEAGLLIIQNRCVGDPTNSRARDDIPLYLGSYVSKCGELGEENRAKESCYGVLLVLQPVVEDNPENYALAEIYGKVKEIHDDIGQVATVE
jgi:hypothetical protein